MASQQILAKLAVNIAANTAEFNKALNKSQGELKSFTGGITKIAGAVGLAFGLREVGAFTLEVSRLAGEAQGVQAAFDKLPGSVAVMNQLKQATGGTVSELDLMKRTVQAANFGISLGSLPKLLEFATLRAQQTGQSVDYLVDSIVTGIGRKSPLILDNLGISAVALKEKLGDVSIATADVGTVANAVGKIAEESLSNMAGFSDDASSRVQQLGASWDNLKVSIGKAVNNSGLPAFVQGLADAATVFGEIFLGGQGTTLAKKEVDTLIKKAYELREAAKLAGNQADVKQYTLLIAQLSSSYGLVKDKAVEYNSALEEQKKAIENIENLTIQLNDLKAKQVTLSASEIGAVNNEILAIEAKIKALKELGTAQSLSRASLATGTTQTTITGQKSGADFLADTGTSLPTPDVDASKAALAEIGAGYFQLQTNIEDWATAANMAHDMVIAKQQQQAEVALAMGDAMGDAFGSVISGQKTMVQAMQQAAQAIIKILLQRALAGIISSATTSGGPPPVVLALAAAGVAAVNAMFSKFAGVGGSSAGAPSITANRAQRVDYGGAQFAQNITVNGVITANGNTLQVVLNNNTKRNGRTRG